MISLIGEKDIPFTLFTNGRWPKLPIDLLKSTTSVRRLVYRGRCGDARSVYVYAGSFEETCENIRESSRRAASASSTVLSML